jgi:hypothetical protein
MKALIVIARRQPLSRWAKVFAVARADRGH